MDTPRRSRRPVGLRLALSLALVFAAGAVLATAEDPPKPPAPPVPPVPAPDAPPTDPEARRSWRESMWAAPTEADWKKPVLLTWQRTWEDAVAVAKETGRPILVCINMDGEIASEHYAGVRYRQPEIAALYEPYVTVIASVYRHNPRDHDDDGNRIPCPRFGGVTCGEHIAIEPGIFEKFCDGKRIAPRHIMVELAPGNVEPGKTEPGAPEAGAPKDAFREVYDVYYRNDTASVFADVKKGIADRPAPAPVVVRGDRPVVERVASRDVRDRTAVEAAYKQGDAATRRSLLEAAARHADVAQLDLMRLAVFGLDADLSRAARDALAKVEAPAATELVAEALRVPMDAAERDALIATLKRLGSSSTLARWLAVVHTGLAGRSGAVDPTNWAGGASYGAPSVVLLEDFDLPSHVEHAGRLAEERPDDPEARLDFAEASLALAMEAPTLYAAEPAVARRVLRGSLEDARRAGKEAERLGATGWRVNAVIALAAYYASDPVEGYARAEAAMKDLPQGDGSWASMAVLTVFAEARWKGIKKATKEKLDFPPEWLTDVNAAYAVLRKHPLGTDTQVLWHQDLLDWLGAYDQAERVLKEGLARFRDSAPLHERWRRYLLKRRGVEGLEAAYEALAREQGASASVSWFAGLASTEAGDQLRRAGQNEKALAAYDRAIAAYDRAVAAAPDTREGPDRAAALALAGKARVAYQMGDDDQALREILGSFERSPSTAGTRDGMGITPGETAQMLLARLRVEKRVDLIARLETALAGLDPDLLLPDRE